MIWITVKSDLPKQEVVYSPDSSYILTLTSQDDDNSKRDFVLDVVLIDSSVNVTQMDRITKKDKGQLKYDIINGVVNNDGEAYVLVKKKKNFKKKFSLKEDGEKVPNDIYQLFKFKGDSHEVINVEGIDDFTGQAKVYINDSGEIIVVSSILEKDKLNSSLIGWNVEILNDSANDFKSIRSFISKEDFEYWGFKKGKPKYKYLDDFHLSKQIITIGNSYYFLAERRGSFDNGNVWVNTSKTAMILKVSPEIDKIEVSYVPKNAPSGFVHRESVITQFDQRVYLIYNDYKRNLDKDIWELKGFEENGKLFKSNKVAACYAYLNDQDEIVRRELPNSEDLYMYGELAHSKSETGIVIPFAHSSLFKKMRLHQLEISLK